VDPEHRARLSRILDTFFADNVKARELRGDGTLVKRDGRKKPFRAQESLWHEARELAARPHDPERGALHPIRKAP
jgi:polyphosphate kinase